MPATHPVEQTGPQPRRYHGRHAEQQVEAGHHRRTHARVAQQRDDERHVADIADTEQSIARQREAETRPARRFSGIGSMCGGRAGRMNLVDLPRGADGNRGKCRRRRRERKPRKLPAMHGVDNRQRHQHRRGDDAPAGPAVIQTEHQSRLVRSRGCKPRREHAAADENRRAAHAGNYTQREQRMCVGQQTADRHQKRSGRAAGAEQYTGRPAARELRKGERAQQIAQRIGGVHRASLGKAPAEVEFHRRQQQRVGKTGKAQRDRAA
ncbi:hypothetical protein KCU90_g1073, partial [Aureobasidium melanogenum]